MNEKNIIVLSGILVLIMGYFVLVANATNPTGATDTEGTPETKGEGTAGNVVSEGGNITEVNLSGATQTTHWQGFWGQVIGAITLDDASDNTLYNWSIGTMSGNIYISNKSSGISWSSCTNVSASWCNNIVGTGDDSCTNTFDDSTKTFTIAGNSIPGVNITQTFNAAGTGAWDEGILNCSNEMLFAATIYNNANTFKNGNADFQAIVPVNGTATKTYYFWIELGV